MKKPLPYLPNAFTLVELIVVIAVLSVLAAISFTTVANISSGARDSARLTDISSMKTSLETYNATKGGFPMPDNAVAISWSGNLAWSQGTFGDNTARALNTISRPKDPKWGVDYSYSVVNSKREYEVATVLEKATSFNGISKAYANGEQYEPTIKGNYNGVAVKVSSTISTWILSVPTIIASDIKDAKLENVVFAYGKSGNVPFSYAGSITSPQAVPTAWIAKQVWSGAVNILPNTDSELQGLTNSLKPVFSTSPAASSEVVKWLLATTDTREYGANLVRILGGSITSGGPKVCKICGATSGTISAFAGGFSSPSGLAMDSLGNLYTANYLGNTIFKITPSGATSLFASIANPSGVSIDASGNLYVTSSYYGTVYKITPTGSVIQVSNTFVTPSATAMDTSGNLYVANFNNNNISKVSSAGVITPFASGGGLTGPNGIVIDNAGNLYVSNYNVNAISKVTPEGSASQFVTTGSFRLSGWIVMDTIGNLYVTGGNNSNEILKITPAGVISKFFVNTGNPYGVSNGLILDTDGVLYVTNTYTNSISKITPQ